MFFKLSDTLALDVNLLNQSVTLIIAPSTKNPASNYAIDNLMFIELCRELSLMKSQNVGYSATVKSIFTNCSDVMIVTRGVDEIKVTIRGSVPTSHLSGSGKLLLEETFRIKLDKVKPFTTQLKGLLPQ